MATLQRTLLAAILFGLLSPFSATAQNNTATYKATPSHMWEFGLHAGPALVLGDVDFMPNWGTGFHVRRAFDYVFSVRGEGLYSVLKYDDNEDGSAETKLRSGSVQLVVSLNNLVWSNAPRRKVNVYGFVGGGVTHFEVEVKKAISSFIKPVDPVLQTHADFGIGIALRVADRFNLGFETKGQALFGTKADLLDGVARREKDILVYPSLRLNFNIGNKEKRAEPLYWVNPMETIMQDMTELKSRPPIDMTDTDGDGVIDLFDADNNTPPGVAVDTRGVALDSDGDGIPDYLDDEPYVHKDRKDSTPKTGDQPVLTESDVNRILDDKLNEYYMSGSLPGTSGMANWFLPMIHFAVDSDKIRYTDFGSLSSVAQVMKANPNLRVVVTGYTDNTASPAYNLDLSFKRAKAAIEHLVNVHGIARSRLILNYNGEDYPLVPVSGSTIMNRRVEFRVATPQDVDMEQPVPVSRKDKKSGY